MGYLDARTAVVDLTKGTYGFYKVAIIAMLAALAIVLAIPILAFLILFWIVKGCYVLHYKGKARRAISDVIPARALFPDEQSAERFAVVCANCQQKLAVDADATEVGCPKCNEWTNFVRCPATGQTVRALGKHVVYKCPHCGARHPNPGYAKLNRETA